MCSFDVVSLFTNIPVDKAIDICLKNLYKDTDKVNNLTCEQFKRLLKYCVKENHFQFEDKYLTRLMEWLWDLPLAQYWPIFFVRFGTICT